MKNPNLGQSIDVYIQDSKEALKKKSFDANVKLLLEAAFSLIEDSARYCQGHWNINADNRPFSIQRCALGALLEAGNIHHIRFDHHSVGRAAYEDLYKASHQLFPEKEGVIDVNDALGHSAILDIYRLAISYR